MYTMVERRKTNPARLQETVERAHAEYFPKLQRAPGFVGFYLVADEANAINTAVLVWESKAHAGAFMPEVERWMQVLDEHGHAIQSDNRGETVITIESQQ